MAIGETAYIPTGLRTMVTIVADASTRIEVLAQMSILYIALTSDSVFTLKIFSFFLNTSLNIYDSFSLIKNMQ